tara:strand:- start:3450 stop:3650 length:201 start_codon:yes stop_codon:yes gene_type:complete
MSDKSILVSAILGVGMSIATAFAGADAADKYIEQRNAADDNIECVQDAIPHEDAAMQKGCESDLTL